jgi:hypothetical protein
VTGDDLDKIAFFVGKVGREAKLADEDDFAAPQIDRQHGRRRSGAQQVAHFDLLAGAACARSLVGTESAAEDFAARDHHVRGFIGDRICA